MNATKTPKYRRHRSGGRDRAFVELDGQRTYLGCYRSPESIQRYDQLVAEWLVSGRRRAVEPSDLTEQILRSRQAQEREGRPEMSTAPPNTDSAVAERPDSGDNP